MNQMETITEWDEFVLQGVPCLESDRTKWKFIRKLYYNLAITLSIDNNNSVLSIISKIILWNFISFLL